LQLLLNPAQELPLARAAVFSERSVDALEISYFGLILPWRAGHARQRRGPRRSPQAQAPRAWRGPWQL